jgi:hypothetical protein
MPVRVNGNFSIFARLRSRQFPRKYFSFSSHNGGDQDNESSLDSFRFNHPTIHKASLPKYITLLRIPVRQDQLLNTAVLISKIQVLPVFWVSNILWKLIDSESSLEITIRLRLSAPGTRLLDPKL